MALCVSGRVRQRFPTARATHLHLADKWEAGALHLETPIKTAGVLERPIVPPVLGGVQVEAPALARAVAVAGDGRHQRAMPRKAKCLAGLLLSRITARGWEHRTDMFLLACGLLLWSTFSKPRNRHFDDDDDDGGNSCCI